jgi:nucleoside-diphosphate-sugar epimerase
MIEKAAILGATGPTGRHLVRELLAKAVRVRVVARNSASLARCFAGLDVEQVPADILDTGATVRAIAGCELVFDCIGLPAERMADHPRTARNIAAAMAKTGARCVQISSYWAYLPLIELPLNEQHPRVGGVFPVQMRRAAEDILQQAGAAIAHLPDFYGPLVHTSLLQRALLEAASGKPIHWIGSPEVEREHSYVPDAMRTIARLAEQEGAYGERWIVPGAGPLSGQRFADLVSRVLGRPVKLRPAGLAMLRIVSLFSKPLRAFMPMIPAYLKPIAFDGSKLEGLIGKQPVTSYEEGIRQTLQWLQKAPG